MRFAGVVRDAAHAALDHGQGAFLGVRACELAETDGPRSRSGSRVTARNRKPGRVARFPNRLSLHGAPGLGLAAMPDRSQSFLRPPSREWLRFQPGSLKFSVWAQNEGRVLQAPPPCR